MEIRKMKKIACSVLMALMAIAAIAQSGTNSPYSQYGLGQLSEQTSGFNRGMNGLGYGFREHNQVNFLNPASYASIDSLTFIFDAGISGYITNFKEGGKSKNAQNANFEYAVAAFKVGKRIGLSFGILPYTNVGYNYSNTQTLYDNLYGTKTTTTNLYSGSGGLHQVYLGAGWMPFKGFAIGANLSYLWGDYERSITNSYSDANVNTLSKIYTATVNNYKLDFGVQYTAKMSKRDELTIGLTYGLGHKLNADPMCKIISTNSQTAVSDTTTYTVDNGLAVPATFGAGFVWNRENRLKLGVDYSLQKWASVEFPYYSVVNERPTYQLTDKAFTDRHKLTVGGDYCPRERGNKFFQRVHYRFGVSYATPYLRINGQDGPKEMSVSAGVGVPIMNKWNSRSMLNVSAQWVRQDAKSLLTENTFRINIGLTFNERWFAKWKVE